MCISFIFYLDAIHLTNHPSILSYQPNHAFFYTLCASLLRLLTTWFTVSSLSRHILHLLCSWLLSKYALIAFLWIACSYAARIKDSVSLFKLPCFSHSHLASPAITSVYLKNFPRCAFSFQLSFRFILLIFFRSTSGSLISSSKVASELSSFSILRFTCLCNEAVVISTVLLLPTSLSHHLF